MRFKRSAAIIGTTLLVGGLGTASTALAAGSLSQTVISSTAPLSKITVSWSGLNPGDATVFIQQCWKNGNAPGVTFNAANDCNQSLGTNASIADSGAGSKANVNVFNGDGPNDETWGCGPLATAAVEKPADGKCYIRLAPIAKDNVSTDEFLAFSYGVVDSPPVPEVPLNVLLPASAAAVLGAGVLVARKRQLKTTV